MLPALALLRGHHFYTADWEIEKRKIPEQGSDKLLTYCCQEKYECVRVRMPSSPEVTGVGRPELKTTTV